MQQTTNQTILFNLLNAVILPGHQPTNLIRRRSELARRASDIRRVATLPVPFRSPGDWLLLPGAGYDWAFMPVTADPLYHDRRGFPMPKTLIKHLRKLNKSGVDFDQLWIAHEVQPGKLQPGQRLTVADLMPPPLPRRRPAWHGVAMACAGWLGLALVRGAYGAGQALGTMPTAPAWTPEPASQPVRRVERPTQPTRHPEPVQPAPQPAKPAERHTAHVERPTQRVEPPQPHSEPVRPPALRSEPVEVAATPEPQATPTPEPASERRRGGRAADYQQRDMRSSGQPATNVWWGDSKLNPPAGSTLRPDLSQRNLAPAVEVDGRVIYPNHWGSYRQGVSREEYLSNSCEVDPILFGVNVVEGIADLYYLGSWMYGTR